MDEVTQQKRRLVEEARRPPNRWKKKRNTWRSRQRVQADEAAKQPQARRAPAAPPASRPAPVRLPA